MFAGIDIGSTSTKAILMDDTKVVGYHIVPSGSDFRKSSQAALDEAIKRSNSDFKDIVSLITTGYGRYITELATKTTGVVTGAVTEITCAGRGAFFFCPGIRTVLDIGGQDTKAIKLSDEGRVLHFALNDKCAAGTGRFLERLATSLELGMDKMAALSLNSPTTVPISSTCTVFAETEVISRISRGESLKAIVRGLHNALAGRICGLTVRVGFQTNETVLICGGGALNAGLVRELKEIIGNITLPPSGMDPRLLPAVGAALIGKERSGI